MMTLCNLLIFTLLRSPLEPDVLSEKEGSELQFGCTLTMKGVYRTMAVLLFKFTRVVEFGSF